MTRRARLSIRILMAALLLFAGMAGGCYLFYPELVTLGIRTIRHSSLEESRNVFAFLGYFAETSELLRRDPETGAYTLEGVDGPALDPFERGYVAFHRGDFAAAVRWFERSVDEEGPSEERLFWLGLAYLRRGEAVNCQVRSAENARGSEDVDDVPPGAFCSLPLRAFHEVPEPSRRAGEIFQRLLDRHDSSDAVYRWLLNFAAMTVDSFPDGVPERYRIEGKIRKRFYGARSREVVGIADRLRFRDRAPELGVDRLDTGRGVAVEDFDRDGDLDLVVGGTFEDVRFYRNEISEGGRFRDVTAEVGLSGVLQPFFLSGADYDDDGWIDLLVGRPFHRFVLFRNEEGRFRDVTAESGLLRPGDEDRVATTWDMAWGDADRDGDLDLFLAQWGVRFPSSSALLSSPRMRSRFYVNENGIFRDRTRAFGLEKLVRGSFFVGAAFGDYDRDGFPDLMLSSWVPGASVLLHNRAGRGFEDSGLVDSRGFTTAFLDVNHDGFLDIFRGGYGEARTSTARMLEPGERRHVDPSYTALLVQSPAGRFQSREDHFAGGLPVSTMGASYGDLDNDGCLDFYLGTGSPDPWYLVPNLMYLGRASDRGCGEGTVEISRLFGFGTVQKGHGIVFFDFDGDGDQDVYSALGGMWPGDRWRNQLFVNESANDNAWVKLRLRGRRTNRHGVGAMIRVSAVGSGGETLVRTYHMDDKTGFGSAPYLAHIGLGPAVAIEEVEVRWPVSGCRKTYSVELGRPGSSPRVLDEGECGELAGSTDSPRRTHGEGGAGTAR